MYRHIYENLGYGKRAVYQIKFKGYFTAPVPYFFRRFEMTVESADGANPITMLTGIFNGQDDLWLVLSVLHQHQHPIVSISCVEIIQSQEQAPA